MPIGKGLVDRSLLFTFKGKNPRCNLCN